LPRLVLIGANGHGKWHRRAVARLSGSGRLRLVGLCDPRPVESVPEAPVPAGARVFGDHRELLAATRPDVAIIATPPHTHRAIATDALRAGCDILLEKPPVLSLAEHHSLAGLLAETGRACQVGFQALGSAALARLVGAIGSGALGTVTAVGVCGSWQRDDAYWARSPWAGRRWLDGRPVLDGALANPFAHALMQALVIAQAGTDGPEPSCVEVERYRARPIEVDDTACLRVTLEPGLLITAAVTLCGEDFIAGEVIVDGTAGRAVLEYPTDRLQLPGEPAPREVPGRVDLLENLLDHRADPTLPLIAPLSTTEPFTAVLAAVQAGPPPTRIGEDRLAVSGTGPARRVTVAGINHAIRRAVRDRALFSELSVPWATAPHRVRLKTYCK
jgi:predicted dehydrogenase